MESNADLCLRVTYKSHDENQLVYGGPLTKLHQQQFTGREKAQIHIRSTLYVSMYEVLGGIPKKVTLKPSVTLFKIWSFETFHLVVDHG